MPKFIKNLKIRINNIKQFFVVVFFQKKIATKSFKELSINTDDKLSNASNNLTYSVISPYPLLYNN